MSIQFQIQDTHGRTATLLDTQISIVRHMPRTMRILTDTNWDILYTPGMDEFNTHITSILGAQWELMQVSKFKGK